jgi:peptidoglycan/LPS O-acetylase OafA/YrhL
MRTVSRSYEPVFGGIVAILASALLCLILFANSEQASDSSAVYLTAYCGVAIAWGLLQIAGYRSAKRKNVALAEPVLDTALGCVFLGLILGLVTVCLYEFAHNTSYVIAAGLMTAMLLCIGAVVGIRRGTWK